MRIHAALVTLSALTLASGVALADKGADRVNEHRTHSDMVDKSYRHDVRIAHEANASVERAVSATKAPMEKPGTSRINCNGDAGDCGAKHVVRTTAVNQPSQPSVQAKSAPDLSAQKSQSRVRCDESDSCGASSKVATRILSTGQSNAGPGANSALARLVQQRTEPRTSQGDSAGGEDASVPSKSNKQFWANEAVKAGTFKGPGDASGARATEKNATERLQAARAAAAQKSPPAGQ
jgi:hypothetical protein